MLSRVTCKSGAHHVRFQGTQHHRDEYVVDVNDAGAVVGSRLETKGVALTEYTDHTLVCQTCGAFAWRPSPIEFQPSPGMVLECDFSTGFSAPEIYKVRPVVVVSGRERNRETTAVVPLSTVAPKNHKAIVVPLPRDTYPFLKEGSFAKCQTVNTIGNKRLLLLKDPLTSRRLPSTETRVSELDLQRIRLGVAQFVGYVDK